jgi:HSP20 family protein
VARRREDVDRLTELEELFADLWQVPRFAAGLRAAHRPQVDCVRSADPPELTIVVELPGADPENIRIALDGRQLVVSGERPRPQLAGQYQRSEIEFGPFHRAVSLPDDVDIDGARAEYERGLLRILLPVSPKPPPAKRVVIEIRRIA